MLRFLPKKDFISTQYLNAFFNACNATGLESLLKKVKKIKRIRFALFILKQSLLNVLSFVNYFFLNQEKPDGTLASWLHDICLQPYNAKPEVFNMVVEIPRHTHAKMEISMSVDKNPIIQDVKKGKLRFLRNVFPNYGVPFNYGALPMVI